MVDTDLFPLRQFLSPNKQNHDTINRDQEPPVLEGKRKKSHFFVILKCFGIGPVVYKRQTFQGQA